MSFRNRLTLFFVAIVIVPMVSVAFVLFRLISDNENGKADARIAARQETAINLYRDDRERAARIARKVGSDRLLARALRSRDDAAARRRAIALLRRDGAVRLRVADRRGERLDVGSPVAIAPAIVRLDTRDGRRFGQLELSARTAPVYARTVKRITRLNVVVRDGRRTLASTVPGVGADPLPVRGEAEVGDEQYRVASFDDKAFAPGRIRVSVLGSQAATDDAVARSRLLAGALLAGFFVLAFTFALLVSRSLQRQIGSFLDAARRLGRGDFSAQVPTEGRDEFAALGDEFNQMARELQRRLDELDTERSRLESQLRRIGEAFASKLDRAALLEIAMRTTVDGVDADGGRATVRPEEGQAPERYTSTGDPAGLEEVVAQAEAEVLATGDPREIAVEAGSALAHPLPGAREGEVEGVVAVWRRRRPFTTRERELFHYLAGQAGVSLENVELHETVQRQAVTDELTGLSNHRRFQEVLASEVERARRFDTSLALVMLDVDNFKQLNDTHGHQVGDQVLHAVADVLRDQSREIDEPARYGGEELALVLPGTDLEGAHQLAERVRHGIESLAVSGSGQAPLRVTASFGVAAMPESARTHSGLISAADGALYAAKRAGKNRTEVAEPQSARPAQ